ncbi:5' nucleotidase, NT5C type [Flavobacterium sp.]|uniref:5' nucleotidase, NT5C type n=1 Tax=Flavobacterium sp. TaxID=239 RepID=UPI003D0CB892
MKKRIIVDIDGVLADIYGQFRKFESQDLGTTQELSEITGKLEEEAFINGENYMATEGFFRNASVIEGSIEVLKELNQVHDVFIVSAATKFPKSMAEKHEWLAEHFPFITWQQIVFCGTKEVIKGDIMIDDHFKNLDKFDGQTLLFSQPHNLKRTENGHTRVGNWKEISQLLL